MCCFETFDPGPIQLSVQPSNIRTGRSPFVRRSILFLGLFASLLLPLSLVLFFLLSSLTTCGPRSIPAFCQRLQDPHSRQKRMQQPSREAASSSPASSSPFFLVRCGDSLLYAVLCYRVLTANPHPWKSISLPDKPLREFIPKSLNSVHPSSSSSSLPFSLLFLFSFLRFWRCSSLLPGILPLFLFLPPPHHPPTPVPGPRIASRVR